MKTLKSDLIGRGLRYDGVSEIEPDKLAQFLLLGIPPSQLRVTESTEDVQLFNAQVTEAEAIRVAGQDPINLSFAWQLPEAYANLDLEAYFAERFEAKAPAKYDAALDRVVSELREVERRGMIEFMRTVIYILDELRAQKVVWGVGRGSSCASYLLFLAGLHVVDCVELDVPAEEFFHD